MASQPRRADSGPCRCGERALATAGQTISITVPPVTLVQAPPELVSQLNVLAVAAISARVYLEAVRAPGFPLPVSKLGKLRLVDRARFVAWLRGLASVARPPGPPAADEDGSDTVLAELGYKTVG